MGACYSGIYEYIVKNYNDKNGLATGFLLPVVGETFDGYLNDIGKMAVTSEMAVKGIESATSEKVKEGNTGGGTGMLCHGFKGGTGSASRVVEGLVIPSSTSSSPQSTSTEGKKEIFTIAALVQSNYGKQQDLKIGGVPVGRLMQEKGIIAEWETTPPTPLPPGTAVPGDGSIIVILATSAPLNPLQLQRLAKRATVGLSRVGGWGANFSGDIFLAFSTATEIPSHANTNPWVPTVQQKEGGFVLDESINALFEAAADVTEEAIYNALCMAEDCIGPLGHKGNAIPLEILREMLERWHVP